MFDNLPFGPTRNRQVSFAESPRLRQVLEDYSDLVTQAEKEDIEGAYLLRKPLSDVEIFGPPESRVRNLASELSRFFFVEVYPYRGSTPERFSGTIFVSRFRTLPRLAADLINRSQWREDLQGVLYGKYDLTEVARYCQPLGLFK